MAKLKRLPVIKSEDQIIFETITILRESHTLKKSGWAALKSFFSVLTNPERVYSMAVLVSQVAVFLL
jgi:hypothetical protein